MDLSLRASACVVTGASGGIGLATARLLCAEGAHVLLVARRPGPLDEALDECRRAGADSGARVDRLAADVGDPHAARAIVERCEERFGGIDVLVNNAGTTSTRPLEDLRDEEWHAQWELNVMAPLRLMREAAPRMTPRGAGRIVNVASSSGKRPGLNNAAYSVTKSAQLSLSRVFADAWAPRGVLVNAVAPGPVGTSLWTGPGGLAEQAAARAGGSAREAVEAMARRVPVGRLGSEEEIAIVIALLCSPAASFVAGAAWSVDGGYVPQFL
ncbi:MAG TPA: SDR family oxidoreductase [Solirubrobacteraceae bacterium]|nr:SDR family oxidoreductase [Solirubrobacteraceae bacterium]